MSDIVHVTLTQQQGYQFLIDFGAAMPTLLADEPPPLGEDSGPSPAHLLVAAAANCLLASFLFALSKYKQDAGQLTAEARCEVGRNAEGRMRVLSIDVVLRLGKVAAEIEHLDRILGQFEPFCTVSQSISAGVPVHVSVRDGRDTVLKD